MYSPSAARTDSGKWRSRETSNEISRFGTTPRPRFSILGLDTFGKLAEADEEPVERARFNEQGKILSELRQ